jgi:LPS sulfotransferase NodH
MNTRSDLMHAKEMAADHLADYSRAWSVYTAIKGMQWPANKYTVLDRQTKAVLKDMCATFQVPTDGTNAVLLRRILDIPEDTLNAMRPTPRQVAYPATQLFVLPR